MTKTYVYYCYGGSHSSVVTAAIHLKLLNPKKTPTTAELLTIPFYDQQQDKDHGKMRFMGEDEKGNKVYIVGQRSLANSFEKLVHDYLKIIGCDEKPILINTLSGVNMAMRLGGYMSRKLGYINIGRPLVIWGTKKAFKNFVEITKQKVG